MNWINSRFSERIHYYITDHLGTVRAILDSEGGIKSTHDYEPFGVELQPLSDNSTNFNYKYTGQERDNSTNLDYMHFRYYASTMGRFLKPDNIIPNPANPQSWNLYTYVNGNPVMFNDPLGHSCPASIGTSPALNMVMGSADWVNWGAVAGFYSNLYGGNVAFGGGAGGTAGGSGQSGYWQSVYDTTTTTSDTRVWNEELGRWIDGEIIVTATQVGVVWVEYGGGGAKVTPVQESLWERWKYNFIRTNKAVPGLLAPTGLTLFTSKTVGSFLEMPTLGQWIANGFRGVSAAGVEWTATETGILVTGTTFANFIFMGLAFESGVAVGSLIQVVVIEPLQPEGD